MILVEPQLGENIGMVARAMLNCGLADLRLVRPRDPWPNEEALAAAAGADHMINAARLFDSLEEAVAELQVLYASTARSRDMAKKILSPREAAGEMITHQSSGTGVGVLFGKESKGLKNDDLALADTIINVPLNPSFRSLNIAQAVFVVAYEWFLAAAKIPPARVAIPKETRPANKQELIGLFEHLESELDACGFLHVKEKRPVMVRNLRNMLQRAGLTEQEVRTLRGVITGLVVGDRNK